MMKRRGATSKGLVRRLRDLVLSRVPDGRAASRITWPIPTLLTAVVVGLLTRARSLRAIEQRTAQVAFKHGAWQGITGRISDNTVGGVLPRVPYPALVGCLHRLVKAEARRGNLAPHVLARGTVAVDGKHVATLRWHDLCRVLEVDAQMATPAEVCALMAERFAHAQMHHPEQGLPYALVRVHTVTLISSKAAVPVHQRPIPADTNEIGALPGLYEELRRAYGRTKLFERVTTDAGNTSLLTAGRAHRDFGGYFAQLKSTHGALHAEAVRALAKRRPSRAAHTEADKQQGNVVTYHVWTVPLGSDGWLDWTHARQLVRVRRLVEDPQTGKRVSVGNRYYVTSDDRRSLPAAAALYLARTHWRCENETHWTSDAELLEDRRRLAYSRHPDGVLVVALLRMIALAILAVARKLSRTGYTDEPVAWTQLAEHFFLTLCGPILTMEAFDNG